MHQARTRTAPQAPLGAARCRLIALPAFLLPLLLLAACSVAPVHPTARPQPTPIPDDTLPPSLAADATPRQRIIETALQEWRRWGSQRVTVSTDGRGCVSESPLPPTDDFLAAQRAADSAAAIADQIQPCLRYADGEGMEATPEGCTLVRRYWHLLGREPDCEDVTRSGWAWSAAFISWVMRQAGLNDDQFLAGEAHSMYVADARDGILPAPAFKVEPYPAQPVPGDLICAVRDSASVLTDVAQIRFGRTPMHCDIVVEVDDARGIVRAVGGNVQQSVSMSEIALRRQGATTTDSGEPPQVPWLLVMRNLLR